MPRLTLDDLRQRKDQILALASLHGAHNVRVFGSVARGDAAEGSDLDLVVDFDTGRSLMDHGELIMDLEEVLGCRVDVVSARGLRDRFRDRVFADAVVL
jgi:predicted nucleotidyltransferase